MAGTFGTLGTLPSCRADAGRARPSPRGNRRPGTRRDPGHARSHALRHPQVAPGAADVHAHVLRARRPRLSARPTGLPTVPALRPAAVELSPAGDDPGDAADPELRKCHLDPGPAQAHAAPRAPRLGGDQLRDRPRPARALHGLLPHRPEPGAVL